MSAPENIIKYVNSHLESLEKAGLAREHISFTGDIESWPLVTHTKTRKTLVNWCSNSYLGLHLHPDVLKATSNAVTEFGIGATGTRNISGSNQLIDSLEAKIAKYCGKQESVIFQSAWAANFYIKKLADTIEGCHIFSDTENHNSMIVPLLATKAKQAGRVHKFSHNNAAELKNLIEKLPASEPKIIIFEDIYSMSGEYSPLEEYVQIARQYNCLLFCDVTHSFGLYDDMSKFAEIDIISGTLGKAVGSQGGFIAANNPFAKLARRTDSYIFTTSNSFANVAASLKALEIISSAEGNELRNKQRSIVNQARTSISQALPHFNLEKAKGHILPLIVGDEIKCKELSAKLFDNGIYLQPIFYPTVEKGNALLRLAPSALHTEEMVSDLVKNLTQSMSSRT